MQSPPSVRFDLPLCGPDLPETKGAEASLFPASVAEYLSAYVPNSLRIASLQLVCAAWPHTLVVTSCVATRGLFNKRATSGHGVKQPPTLEEMASTSLSAH
jgi:hypothetical protein